MPDPPLHLAAFHNQTNTLKLLISAGAQVNQADPRGLNPLHWAVINGAAGAATLLLKHKADLNAPVAETGTSGTIPFGRGPLGPQSLAGDTPLHLASLLGRTNMISMLLQAGANVNAANASSQTPLDLSNNIRRFPIMASSLGQRTMWDLLEPLGISPAALLTVTNSSAVANLLEKAGGKHSSNGGFRGPPHF